MNLKSIVIWSMCLLTCISFSSCEIWNQLLAAQGIKNGNISIVQGDNTLPGAQKGGTAIKNQAYKGTVKANGTRYIDHVFQNVKKTHETYATANQFNGKSKTLMMDIYTPVGDNVTKRPCVIFVFGGGWFMKTLDGMSQFGKGFAMRGYVGVSVDYRIGFQNGTGMAGCKNNYNGFDEAWYRAAQDVKASIRYLKANADRLGIDKNKIFVGGHSAGGFTTLNAVHLDDADVAQVLKTKLGGVNSVGKHQNENTTVAGYYVMSGGAIRSLDYVDKKIPSYLILGNCDEFIANGSGKFYKCNTNPMLYAGQALHNKLKSNGGCTMFDVVCGGDHGYSGLALEKQVALVNNFVVNTLKGTCKTKKSGFYAPTRKCQTVDAACN